jgi:hypothetical protein
MEMEMEHEFTLIIGGISDLTPAIMDALFEAGCDDATVSRQGGRICMDFVRAAPNLKHAVVGAIRDVEKANVGARILGVEVSEPGSIREIIEGDARHLVGARAILEAGAGRITGPSAAQPAPTGVKTYPGVRSRHIPVSDHISVATEI